MTRRQDCELSSLTSNKDGGSGSKGRSLDATTTAFGRWGVPIIFCHLSLGMFMFSRLEHWSHRDAMYFCITVLTTVGYGDLAPKTVAGKIFTCIYIVAGISIVSASLGAVFGQIYANMKTRVHASGFSGRLLSAFGAMAFVTIGGACSVHISEGWSAVDSVYWAIITCSSVGLGDLSISEVSRSWNTMYLLLAVGVFAVSAGSIANVFADIEVKRSVDSFLADGVNENLIAEMDEDHGGSVSQYEFLTYMLVHTGKVTKGDIHDINNLFASLDRDGSGSLDKGDIHAAMGTVPSMPSKKKVDRVHGACMKRSSMSRVAALWPCLAIMSALGDSMSALVQWPQQISHVKIVDGVVAGCGLSLSVLMLCCLDISGHSPIKFFAPPMLASAIIFFGGAKPPPPGAFVTCTIGSFVVGTLLHQFDMQASMVIQCFAAGLLLLFKKVSGSFFPPTVGLAAFLAQSGQIGHPLAYLVAPWSTGHLVLYILATLLASVRQSIRVQITKQGWKQQIGKEVDGPEREAHLRKIFDRFDTSGDGQLDAMELKLALRSLTGTELEIEDCERMIRSMDTDGDGGIDFHEFVLALDEHL